MIVYTLELADGCYYVGRAKNPEELPKRVEQHRQGEGSEWTKAHPVVKLVHQIDDAKPTDEDARVIELAAEHGIARVRGGAFCSLVLEPTEERVFAKMVDSARGACYTCHSTGHCVTECPINLEMAEKKGGDWICGACDNLVFASKSACRCGAAKPAQPVRADLPAGWKRGDWACPKCGDHQFSKNTTCRRCGMAKQKRVLDESLVLPPGAAPAPAPAAAAPPPLEKKARTDTVPAAAPLVLKQGDWVCGGCEFQNFASRSACFKCKRARPLPDAAPLPTCVVCLDRPVRSLVQPCRHLCLCEGCARDAGTTIKECPMCRGPIERTETVYQ